MPHDMAVSWFTFIDVRIKPALPKWGKLILLGVNWKKLGVDEDKLGL